MKCSNCGKEIPGDSKFCEYCGIRIKSTSWPSWVTFLIILTASIFLVLIVVLSVEEQSRNYSTHTEPWDEYATDSIEVVDTCAASSSGSSSDNYLYTNDNNYVFDYEGGYDNRQSIYIYCNEGWSISTGTADWAHCEKSGDYVILWCDYNPNAERDDYIILTSDSGLDYRIEFHQK